MKRILMLVMLAAAALAVGSCAAAIRPAPPPRMEVKTARPYTSAVWVNGHWKWSRWKRRYVWVPGHWKVKKARRGKKVIIVK